jgi:hypothetical protein
MELEKRMEMLLRVNVLSEAERDTIALAIKRLREYRLNQPIPRC